MKRYSYQIPERKIGEVFSYDGNFYKTEEAKESFYGIGCTKKDNELGHQVPQCAFADYCGRVNMVHRGRCASFEREDKKVVCFKKVNVVL